MDRVAYSGEYRAVWSAEDRRWYVYGPGGVLMTRVPGKRKNAVYYMRAMQGLPASPPSMRSVVARMFPQKVG